MGDEKIISDGNYVHGNALANALQSAWTSFSDRRAALGLTNPGTVENIDREVKRSVFLTNQMFSGLRADWSRPFSASPMFSLSHGFSIGSQGLPPYNFTGMFGTKDVFMQGNVDNDGQLSARTNYKWSDFLTTKTDLTSSSAQSMLQIDNEFTGRDFSAGIKAMNPSFLEGGISGIIIGSYLQSITPRLALGLEAMWNRPGLSAPPDMAVSYCARYRGSDWIASAQILAQGAVNTSYWRRLTDKVEAGADLQLQFAPGMRGQGLMGGGLRKDGTATAGLKYDFTTSAFRAQVDSSGKLACLLEKRVLPPVQVTFAGEMDPFRQQCKMGLAVSIEAPDPELMRQQEQMGAQLAPPPVPY